MNLTIEDNFIELQKKTTHVLVEQKLALFQQNKVDSFLDKINEIKRIHAELIPYYGEVIELAVSFLQKSQPVEDLISISESINNVVATTVRLIQSFQEGNLKACFMEEITAYAVLLDDIEEILSDINNRVNYDSEMAGLLDSL